MNIRARDMGQAHRAVPREQQFVQTFSDTDRALTLVLWHFHRAPQKGKGVEGNSGANGVFALTLFSFN